MRLKDVLRILIAAAAMTALGLQPSRAQEQNPPASAVAALPKNLAEFKALTQKIPALEAAAIGETLLARVVEAGESKRRVAGDLADEIGDLYDDQGDVAKAVEKYRVAVEMHETYLAMLGPDEAPAARIKLAGEF
jgi:hypothetical protein